MGVPTMNWRIETSYYDLSGPPFAFPLRDGGRSDSKVELFDLDSPEDMPSASLAFGDKYVYRLKWVSDFGWYRYIFSAFRSNQHDQQ